MAAVINTNIASLNAQRNLSTSQSQLATSLQRLSSGLRINSAKDDAAGLAISERFTTQIRGMNVAARNANDGISLAQTAEGAMTEIGNNLQRIRELAVQSRNATNSSSDRAALNAEAQQLKSEIDRVASTTSFNGIKLLDGSFTKQAFQVGANQGETIAVAKIADAKSSELGTYKSVSKAFSAPTANTAINEGDIKINNVAIGAVAAGPTTFDAKAQGTAVADAINAKTAETGVTASADASTGAITLSNADGKDIVVGISGTDTSAETGLTAGTLTTTTNGVDNKGFASLDISTTSGADKALLSMDAALSAINSARADMGAVQNRFTSVVANLQTTSENLSASRSRIQDADFAAETANLTRGQILQQAGTAMLAQANGLPNGVLALLRG